MIKIQGKIGTIYVQCGRDLIVRCDCTYKKSKDAEIVSYENERYPQAPKTTFIPTSKNIKRSMPCMCNEATCFHSNTF